MKFPFQPNTESFVGKTNRQIVEQEEATERAEEGTAEEAVEGDESGGNVPTMPPSGAREY